MEKNIQFVCGNCDFTWNSAFYDEEESYKYWAGSNCPKCESTDISS